MASLAEPIWRTPEALVTIGFEQSRVVLLNEAHSGWRRCVRTRVVGRSILPAAHVAGVRHLAMEALFPAYAEEANRTRLAPSEVVGYLGQPEMQSLVQAALDLGWTLCPYESDDQRWQVERYGEPGPLTASTLAAMQADRRTLAYTNWREAQQAQNLNAVLAGLLPDARLLVWCGNGHLSKMAEPEWTPMGYHLMQLGAAPFAIDQTRTVSFGTEYDQPRVALAERFRLELEARGGTAGWLTAEGPGDLPTFGADACVLSLENELE